VIVLFDQKGTAVHLSLDLATVVTPAGPFVVVASADAVLASGWTDDPLEVVGRIHPRLRPDTVRERRDLGAFTAAVHAYLDGDLGAVHDVPVVQAGGPFLEHAWKVLHEVAPGEVITYTQLAERCGNPAAVRAAASACARNAPALYVPCHRVRRTDGSLGGFRWGLPVKRWLLDHERPAEQP
jgi:methylated-DNA-[protein]-cysteine S-methyltransferase